MIEQRVKGLFLTFGIYLVLANIGLFLLCVYIEKQCQIFGLIISETTFAYLLGIPAAYFLSINNLNQTFQHLQAPSIWKSITSSLRLAMFLAGALFTIYFFLKDVSVSRFFLLSFISVFIVFNVFQIYFGPVLLSRMFFPKTDTLRAVLYGHGPLPDDLRHYVKRANAMGLNFVGYYSDESLQLRGIEWLGNTSQVLTCEGGRKRVRADIVFAYSDRESAPEFRDNIDLCMRRGARIQIFSHLSTAFLDSVRIISDGRMQFFTFYDEPLQNPVNVLIKRTTDILISLPVVFFILPPLTAIVWLVHRFQSPGPLLFKQIRYGMNRRPFTILKFRTMHVHDRKEEGKQATKEDPRIFGFGRFLRKTSLDEFPQFFNSLRGNMSVVGPRPHLTLHDDKFEKYFRRYRSRHFVKPGITGLAQVSGYRGEATDDDAIIGRVRHDIHYITHWRLSSDIYIVLKTMWQVLFPPKSAY